jgi:hypothetical protein
MDINIEKEVVTKNDVVGEPLYTVYIKRNYGTGDLHWHKDDWLHKFDEADMIELAQKLSDHFLKK